ncbi:hypothetical protein HK16_10445 [Acetobacter senegalensis]|uniref:HTH cro/C1-type domain-containing protein n=2 Tax=Acetobacter TaxID=434 RepID=A0A252EJ38_9PROT|nr:MULTISPECIES: helix-turn-helix transcriptional regulator [Acetobacter]ATJ92881.1 XRE family transcriptional regulator [Acetobacter tropicalis]OUL66386.1 hypothetical protein HK16_10445 [Acetobacter senegalensis]
MAKKPKEKQANARLFIDSLLYKRISTELTEHRKKIGLSVKRLSLISGVTVTTIKYFESSRENGKGFSVGTVAGLIKAMKLDPMKVLPSHGGLIVDFPPKLTASKVKLLLQSTDNLKTFKPQILDLIRSLTDVARVVKPDVDAALAVFTAEETYNVAPQNSLESLITFGRRLRSLRILKDWSRADLANTAGVALGSIFVIEAGMQNPSLQTLYQLAEALNVHPAFFIRYDEVAANQQIDLERRAASMIAGDQISQVSDLLATLEYIRRTTRPSDALNDTNTN